MMKLLSAEATWVVLLVATMFAGCSSDAGSRVNETNSNDTNNSMSESSVEVEGSSDATRNDTGGDGGGMDVAQVDVRDDMDLADGDDTEGCPSQALSLILPFVGVFGTGEYPGPCSLTIDDAFEAVFEYEDDLVVGEESNGVPSDYVRGVDGRLLEIPGRAETFEW
ncbi:MAG: hypothetical protein MK135_17425, partial [Polyangiaceae bacterium]|nr:hypothetical protein [Polyangiaceae bacterium]